MITELAEIRVRDVGDAFAAAVAKAAPLFASAPGCHGLTLHRSVEHRDLYWLMVGWDSVADHEAFRGTEAFARWRALAGPHFSAPPRVEHLEQILG